VRADQKDDALTAALSRLDERARQRVVDRDTALLERRLTQQIASARRA
jgi:hypothetical protein